MKPEHAWLRTARIFALESWWPPFWPHLELDWDRALWTMRRLHLDTLQANALTKWACYPTSLVDRHPELGSRDLIQEAQEFCARHKFRWIVYSLFGHPMPISAHLSKKGEHSPAIFRPALKDKRPKPAGHYETVPKEFQEYSTHFHHGGEFYVDRCVFADEDWLLAMVRELAGKYDYDACWLDGSLEAGESWLNDKLWNVCTCPVCQEAHLRDFKRPLPLIETAEDPRLLGLRRWVMRRLDAVLGRVAAAFSKDGRVPLVGNVGLGLGGACFYPPLVRNLNGGLFEQAIDTLQLAIKLKLSRHTVGAALHYPDGYDALPRMVTSGWEVENKGLIIAAYGGTPYLAEPGKYYYDDSNDEPARRIFEFMEKRRELLDQQTEFARYAIATQPPYQRDGLDDLAVAGWFAALLDGHQPATVANFYQLEDPDFLKSYPAWILPNTEMLSERALKALHSYVEGGGGLYLCMDTGSVDENRKRRDGSLITELFDIRRWQPSREQLLRRVQFDGGRSLTYDMYMSVEERSALEFPLPGRKIHPTYLGQFVPGPAWKTLAWVKPTDRDEALFPAVAVRSLGKGKLAFSTSGWGMQYFERRDPALGAWMCAVAQWLAGQKEAYRVEASRTLFCAPARVKNGWLFYLVNNSNDVQHRRQNRVGLMKVWERPFPIGPVSLSVPQGRRVEAIYGSSPNEAVRREGGLHITYRDFRDHAVLYVEDAVSL